MSNSASGVRTLQLLYLIPARSGSKGVPGKNIAIVGRQPLLAWTLQAATKAKYQGRLVVSTDTTEIASVAQIYGAETPFLRPDSLASDEASSLDTALHCLEWLRCNDEYIPDYLVLLQPTSPLRTCQDIDGAIDLAISKGAKAVVSVTQASHHPSLIKRISEQGFLENFMELENKSQRRQELSDVYIPNGGIYIVQTSALLSERTWFPVPTYPYVMPSERSIDIDLPWDMYLADLVLKNGMALKG